MSETIHYYEKHASAFVGSTVDVVFTDLQDTFLEYLNPGDRILDFGCGSGRDTKYFLGKGFRVDAMDGSEELCRLASAYTGIEVRQMLFEELDESETYDGIWACASILHCSISELRDVFPKLIRALRQNGILYASFKYGTDSGMRNGRFFTDFTEQTFCEFLEEYPQLAMLRMWTTGDARPGRESEQWLNVLLRKNAM